jgi:hypothetical protein
MTRTPDQILDALVADGIIESHRPQSSLTVIANAIKRITEGHNEMAGYDAGFDGGEFSGPAHVSLAIEQVQAALDAHGWTADEFQLELASRTSAKWAYNAGLDQYLPYDPEQDRINAEAGWESWTERCNR